MIYEIHSIQIGFCTFFWKTSELHFREILVIQAKYPLLVVHCLYILLGHLKQSWSKGGKFLKPLPIRWPVWGKHLWNCLNYISVMSCSCEDVTLNRQTDAIHLPILEYLSTGCMGASAFLGMIIVYCFSFCYTLFTVYQNGPICKKGANRENRRMSILLISCF